MKKRIIIAAVLLAVILLGLLAGQRGKSQVPELRELDALSLPELEERLLGFRHREVHAAWGEPDGSLFGLLGEVYHLPGSSKAVILYYDADGAVEAVKVDYRNDTTLK